MIRKSPLLIAAASVLTAGLSACVGGPASLGGPAPLTPTMRYALQVEPNLDRIALAVHESGVSANQEAAIRALTDRYAVSASDEIVIEAPYGAPEPAGRMAWEVRDMLQRSGVPGDRVKVISYAAPDAGAPVLVGFSVMRAAVPRCGTAWGNLGRTGDNMASANFGCAVTANLAAQIADPRDIVAPRDMAPADMQRRSVVFRQYRTGQQTSAQQEELVQSQAISQAVQ